MPLTPRGLRAALRVFVGSSRRRAGRSVELDAVEKRVPREPQKRWDRSIIFAGHRRATRSDATTERIRKVIKHISRKSGCLAIGVIILFSVARAERRIADENEIAMVTGAAALVQSSIQAMGGERILQSVTGLVLSGDAYQNHLQESAHPGNPWLVTFDHFTEYQDLAGQRMRRKSAQTADAASTTATTFWDELVAAGIDSVSSENDGKTEVDYTATAHDDWLDLGPVRILLTAKQATDLHSLPDSRVNGIPTHVITFHWHNSPVKVDIDSYTNLPFVVEYLQTYPDSVAKNAWGDMTIRITYSNWDLERGGLHYPLQWNTALNGSPSRTVQISKVQVNPALPAELFALTSAIRDDFAHEIHDVDQTPLGEPGNGDPGRPISELQQGVVQIPGEWYATIVDQGDGLVILESPISAGYSSQVIQEAGRRFPGSPIKAVISTSNYWWHIAGIRQYVSMGTPIYCLDLNQDLLAALASSPHLAQPDALAREPRPIDLRSVSGRTVIGSGRNRLEVYPVRTSTTSQMLMVYFPAYKLLYSSDMAQPLGPGGSFLHPQYLWDFQIQAVAADGLEVTTLIGMHMSPTPWAKLTATVDEVIQAH